MNYPINVRCTLPSPFCHYHQLQIYLILIHLQIPFTSSLGEVLALRPQVESGSSSAHTTLWTRKHWCQFGRRLAQWYALLDYWLLMEFDNDMSTEPSKTGSGGSSSAGPVNTQRTDRHAQSTDKKTAALLMIFQFPLLFAADGRWYRPSEVSNFSQNNCPQFLFILIYHLARHCVANSGRWSLSWWRSFNRFHPVPHRHSPVV